MAGVNRVFLLGNLGKDPEFRETQNGGSICNLSIATSRRYKDPQGSLQEETEWHRVVCFNKNAEIARDYLHKGRQVCIEGSLRTRKFTDKNGIERYVTEVLCNQLTLLSNKGGEQQEQPRDTYKSHLNDPPARKQADVPDEDIPF